MAHLRFRDVRAALDTASFAVTPVTMSHKAGCDLSTTQEWAVGMHVRLALTRLTTPSSHKSCTNACIAICRYCKQLLEN